MKLLVFLLSALLMQYWDDSEAVKALKAHVAEITLAGNEGRAPGSEGEKYVASYVWEKMLAGGLDMLSGRDGDVFGIARPEKGDTLRSRNVMGYIQGYDASLRDHYIVVGARMDNLGVNELTVDGQRQTQVYTGANGNASGVAMLLELASKCAMHSLVFKRSIVFVAFGGSTASFSGAWNFLHNTFSADADRIDAMVDLDMLGISRNGMQVYTGGNADLGNILARLSSSLQPVKPAVVAMEPYPSDYQVFYAAQKPVVMFTTGRYPEHNTPRDTPDLLDYDFMEREGEYIYNFLTALANAPAGVPAFSNRQGGTVSTGGTVMSWADCDTPPAFMGNPDPTWFLEKWVYPYLKYPQACIRDGIQGRVMVEFIIGKDGKLRDAKVVRSIDPELDEAALKVVSASPKWHPARMKGQKVDSKMTIPVEFRLKKRKK